MKKILEILTAVEKATGVAISEMKSKSRANYVCHARYMAFFLLYKERIVLQRIADEFNRKDHSTVINGLVQHDSLMVINENYKHQFKKIRVIPLEPTTIFCRQSKSLCMVKKVDFPYPF